MKTIKMGAGADMPATEVLIRLEAGHETKANEDSIEIATRIRERQMEAREFFGWMHDNLGSTTLMQLRELFNTYIPGRTTDSQN
jgi:hypothetical protein